MPVDDPHFLFASDGAAAVEQALKIAFQYWTNRGVDGPHARSSRSAARTTATPSARSRSATAASAPTCSTRCASPCCGRPTFDDPDCFDTAVRDGRASTPPSSRRSIVEPLVQGAAGMQLADPDGLAALGAACRDARRAADLRRGRHRLRPHRHAVRVGAVRPAPRPPVPRQGPHRRLPADVGHGRERAACSTRSSAPTSASARSTTGTPTAGTRSPPRSRCATSSCSTRGTCSPTCAPAPTSCAGCSTTASRRSRRSREVRLRGLMGGVELAPPADGLRWGRRVSRGGGRARRAAPSARRRRRAHAAAHDHLGRARTASSTRSPTRIDEVRDVVTLARLGRRRARRAIRDAGQWRAPRDLDAARPRRARSRRRPRRSCRSRRTTTSASPQHPAVVAAAHDALDRWGTGAGSARLIVGSRPVHRELEARARGVEGHRAPRCCSPPASPPTSACSPRSAGPTCSSCSDELNHASIIDGCRLAGAPTSRSTATATSTHARRAAARADARAARIVVTDTVFSMDGDVAPTSTSCVDVCARHGALLVLDEAHAVLGPAARRATDDVDVLRVGTLSKTLGSLGGFVAGPRALRRPAREPRPAVHLHHRVDARPTPPPRSPRCAVAALARGRRAAWRGCAPTSTASRPGHPSPIVPSSAASEARALDAAAALLDAAACSSPPSGRRRSRRAPPACGSRSRPRTPTTRSTRLVAALGRAVPRPLVSSTRP